MKKTIIKIALSATAMVMFASCSLSSEPKDQKKSLEQIMLDHNKTKSISSKVEINHLSKNYISVDKTKKLSNILNELTEINGNFYLLKGKDLELAAIRNYKIHNYHDLENYISNTTKLKLSITKNKYLTNLPKIVRLVEQQQETSLDELEFNGKNVLVPSDIFDNLSNYTEGWRIQESQDTKMLFNSKTYMTFKGTLRELLDYYALNNDLYLDYDYDNKNILS